jgi:hypothetical protein
VTASHSVRVFLAVTLLAAATTIWAALPMTGVGVAGRLALIAAVCSAVFATLRLAAVSVAGLRRQPGVTAGWSAGIFYDSLAERLRQQVTSFLVNLPWPQVLIVAVLALEALHPRRSWHTAVLGLLVLGYLLALHLAESSARLAELRPQLPLIVAGICLAGLSVAAAALPTGAGSAGSGWLAVIAAIAAVAVAALVLPI